MIFDGNRLIAIDKNESPPFMSKNLKADLSDGVSSKEGKNIMKGILKTLVFLHHKG